jgi:hypothetical protein
MKSRFILLITSLFMICTSCFKEKKDNFYKGDYEVTFQITDELTKEPAIAKVTIWQTEKTWFFRGSSMIEIGYTDSTGRITFNFPVNESHYFYPYLIEFDNVYIRKYSEKDKPIPIFKSGKAYIEESVTPYGIVKCNIKGNNGFDMIRINYSNHPPILNSPRFLKGADTSVLLGGEANVRGNVFVYKYQFVGYHNESKLVETDSIFVIPKFPPDTTYVDIEF